MRQSKPDPAPSKAKATAIVDEQDRARRAAEYATKMKRPPSGMGAATTSAPRWLTVLLAACEKPAKRNPELAAALKDVPANLRPTAPDPKDRR